MLLFLLILFLILILILLFLFPTRPEDVHGKNPMKNQADIGLIGLAVMGENLILNMASKGFTVAAYNRTTSKVDEFVAGRAKGKNIIGCHSVQELADRLEKPRKIVMLVKAGKAVDDLIDQLIPVCEPGDILIDGGNSLFTDTIRRTEYVESKGL